jgi:hypothetical protein
VAPYLRVSGGDIWAGGEFATEASPLSTSCAPDPSPPDISIRSVYSGFSRLGSLTEYAAYARDGIENFGTAGGNEFKSVPFDADNDLLTFGNTPSLGNYDATICIPDYFTLLSNYSGPYKVSHSGGNVNLSTLVDEKQHYFSGSINLDGTSPLFRNKITLVVDGDVTITHDIKYDTNYGPISSLDVPSLVIIAKGNILIDKQVNQIDGLFISLGTIYTCSDGSSKFTELSSLICKGHPSNNSAQSNPLVINGAFIAQRVNFLRTNGTNGGVNDLNSQPAEIFNFSPELYLSNPLLNSDNIPQVEIKTLLVKDLPPIF